MCTLNVPSRTHMRGQHNGRDAQALSSAVNWHSWILQTFPSPHRTKADETCILCHHAPAGALVRQHAEHREANHSSSVIWVTVSSSAPSPTHLLSHHATGPDIGAEHAGASINSSALCYIYQNAETWSICSVLQTAMSQEEGRGDWLEQDG